MAASFGHWLKKRRTAAGLSQDELGDRVASSGETIRKFEADTRRPSAQVADLIAAFFNVPHDEREVFITFARLPTASTLHASTDSDEDDLAPWRSQRGRLTNLPVPATVLIGREQEIAQLQEQILAGKARLLTITGPPGVGKTQLSIAVTGTSDVISHFVDGVYFVPLAPLNDPALVASAIAGALGLQESGAATFADLVRQYLAGKRLLLVLDNFEQITEARGAVADLLANCPWLKIVVTSRVPLHVKGERQFSLSPLALPDPAVLPSPLKLASYPAVRLFVQRAQDVDGDFELTEENAESIAAICARLDGLPLAIELAAARVRVLPPQALLARLGKSLDLLTTGPRHLPRRQQTLRGAVDWSYDLLDGKGKALFRRISLFMGGCTFDAIEHVAQIEVPDAGHEKSSTSHSHNQRSSTLDLVTSLVDENLLRQDRTSSEPRFGMLRVIREYALERLAESGEEQATRRSHAIHFVRLAESAEPYLTSGARGPWLDRLDKEQYNLRAALEWCMSPDGDPAVALRLAGALGWYWYFRGRLAEGRNWLERALSSASELRQTSAGAKALNATASLAMYQRDHAAAYSLLEEALVTWRELGRSTGLAYACTLLGFVMVRKLNLSGLAFLGEGVALFEELGDRWGLAYALNSFGNALTWTPEIAEARSYYRKSLALYREFGSEWDIAYELGALGRTELQAGDLDAAQSLLEQSLEWEQRLGDKWNVAQLHLDLGSVAHCKGDLAKALEHYQDSLRLYEEFGYTQLIATILRYLGYLACRRGEDRIAEAHFEASRNLVGQPKENEDGVAWSLVGLASLAAAAGQMQRLVRLLGAADAQVQALRVSMLPVDRVEHSRNLAIGREALGDDEFDQAWAEGQAMALKQAIMYASEAQLLTGQPVPLRSGTHRAERPRRVDKT